MQPVTEEQKAWMAKKHPAINAAWLKEIAKSKTTTDSYNTTIGGKKYAVKDNRRDEASLLDFANRKPWLRKTTARSADGKGASLKAAYSEDPDEARSALQVRNLSQKAQDSERSKTRAAGALTGSIAGKTIGGMAIPDRGKPTGDMVKEGFKEAIKGRRPTNLRAHGKLLARRAGIGLGATAIGGGIGYGVASRKKTPTKELYYANPSKGRKVVPDEVTKARQGVNQSYAFGQPVYRTDKPDRHSGAAAGAGAAVAAGTSAGLAASIPNARRKVAEYSPKKIAAARGQVTRGKRTLTDIKMASTRSGKDMDFTSPEYKAADDKVRRYEAKVKTAADPAAMKRMRLKPPALAAGAAGSGLLAAGLALKARNTSSKRKNTARERDLVDRHRGKRQRLGPLLAPPSTEVGKSGLDVSKSLIELGEVAKWITPIEGEHGRDMRKRKREQKYSIQERNARRGNKKDAAHVYSRMKEGKAPLTSRLAASRAAGQAGYGALAAAPAGAYGVGRARRRKGDSDASVGQIARDAAIGGGAASGALVGGSYGAMLANDAARKQDMKRYPGYAKDWKRARDSEGNPGKFDRAKTGKTWAKHPDALPSGGRARLLNRIYGPSKVSRVAVPVAASGAAMGAMYRAGRGSSNKKEN